ncbi:hypothetical protein BDY21DRAFT_368550 [Lineolata rhizophorae]|uniref:Uncharacterized protein n=1 Tax=Lineolata rhizophorae TaxID=578093 RepID=A0A6A6PBD6_9PEZI|nr:hypothetical protein BDY21DRAFT_368550 [Lineolata rhizophorae]
MQDIKEAILFSHSCTEALKWMAFLFAGLLEGTWTHCAEEFHITSTPPARKVVFIRTSDNCRKSTDEFMHVVWRVQLKSGEVWAVDLTGAQAGIPMSCAPWHDYSRAYIQDILSDEYFGFCAIRRWRERLDTTCAVGDAANDLQQQMLVELEHAVEAWGNVHNMDLRKLIKSNDDDFKDQRDIFIRHVCERLERKTNELMGRESA